MRRIVPTAIPRRRGARGAALVAGWVAFACGTAAWTASYGVPKSRVEIFALTCLALFLLSAGNARSWLRSLTVDWLPIFAVLFTYDFLRGYADELSTRAHVLPQIRADEMLFAGRVPTVWLQEHLWHAGDPRWYDYATWVVYTSHFFVPLGTAVVLWRVRHALFRQYVPAFVALTLLAFATYWLVPAVPPWMASAGGHIEPTARIVHVLWSNANLHEAAGAFATSPDQHTWANKVAALPSLHGAYPALLACFFWPLVRTPLRVVLVSYVLAMGFALVYGAEHYVFDVLLGWAYALAVALAWSRRSVLVRVGARGRASSPA